LCNIFSHIAQNTKQKTNKLCKKRHTKLKNGKLGKGECFWNGKGSGGIGF
jgi:hypothetical protein